MPTASSPALIPPPELVKDRLTAVSREARLLRRLLKLAREAGLPLTTAARLATPKPKEVCGER